ncbi:hypothetical protein B0H13DRAFT_2271149 [Mycena leptocephala]|nr:hypothetical protein B0H13DRAFT_2271149 [Mycena leptocephala]
MNTFVSFVLLAVCTIAAVPSVLSTPLEKRANFLSDATEIPSTKMIHTTLALNSCIGVLDGKLVSGSNGFLTPCQGLFLSDAEGPTVTLVAKCINDAANTMNTAINLDAFVDNSNGVLKC